MKIISVICLAWALSVFSITADAAARANSNNVPPASFSSLLSHNFNNPVVANSIPTCGVLKGYSSDLGRPNDYLLPNQNLNSCNGVYGLYFQTDGNVVLYKNTTGEALWWTGTNGRTDANYFVMQGDGNLVLYAPGVPLWNSNTRDQDCKPGRPPIPPVCYPLGGCTPGEPGTPPECTPTKNATPFLAVQDDGNLVIYDTKLRAIWASGTNGR